MGKGSFQIEVLTLIQNITENRLRNAKGPVHYIESVTSMVYISVIITHITDYNSCLAFGLIKNGENIGKTCTGLEKQNFIFIITSQVVLSNQLKTKNRNQS